MSETKHDLSLVVKAHDKATGPLARIAAKLRELNVIDKETKKGGGHRPSMVGAFKEIGAAGAELGRHAVELGAKLTELLAIGGAAGFVGLLHGSIEAGAELDKMSQRLGVTATWYATTQKAAELSEVSAEDFANALTKMNKELGAAKAGGGEALSFLSSVSPVLAQQFKSANSTSEAFTLLSKALHLIPDPARRIKLATAIMGKGAVDMAGFMGQGTEAISKQQAEMFALIGAQGKFSEEADGLEKALKRTKFAFEGISNQVMVEFFPAMEELAVGVRGFLNENRDGLKRWAGDTAKAISEWVRDGGLKRLGEGLTKIASAAGWIYDKVGPLGIAIAAAAPLWGPLVSVAWELAAGIGALGVAMGLPAAPFVAATAAVALLVANWNSIKTLPILEDIDHAIVGLGLLADKIHEIFHGPDSAVLTTPEETAAQATALSNVGGATKTIAVETQAAFMEATVPGLGLMEMLGYDLRGRLASVVGGKSLEQRMTGATPAGAAPANPAQPAKAEVTVNFSGAPPGTRVSVAPTSSAEVSYSMGPTMVGP